jgi:hypothetical protein
MTDAGGLSDAATPVLDAASGGTSNNGTGGSDAAAGASGGSAGGGTEQHDAGDGETASSDSSDCGCTVPGETQNNSAGFWIFSLLGLSLLWRRRVS